jgi:hypothetical protein
MSFMYDFDNTANVSVETILMALMQTNLMAV